MSNFVKTNRDAASSFPDYAAVLQWTFDGLRAWESRRHKKRKDPDARTNSIASAMTNGGELRNSTTTCLALAGTVASDGSTFDPVKCTPANPSAPAICTAMEPDSNGLSSFTLPHRMVGRSCCRGALPHLRRCRWREGPYSFARRRAGRRFQSPAAALHES